MAARVRFLSLTLAGFGRYERPTRFVLDGRSCSFTSANELGKSTFHAGLLATLFGPSPARAKLQSFQDRYRSWNRPPWFWGELEFAVSDEHWRVRRDFDLGDLKVWRLASDGVAELRFEERIKPGRKAAESDPYTRMLEDWLGIGDRSLYEAMFTVSQETTLAAAWQIDPRIAERVYGPAVKRLSDNLRDLYDRFREISRNTRDHQISMNGLASRNDGRLDQIVVRIAELEGLLVAARERTEKIDQHRAQLADLDARCATAQAVFAQTNQALEHWQAWVDLESRLRPAVENYERLHHVNERSGAIYRPLADLRGRLAGDLALFDHAPDDLVERLEYYPLLVQAVADAKKRQADQQSLEQWLRGELAYWRETLVRDFNDVRGRPQLVDDLEELRLVRDEIDVARARSRELEQQATNPERDRIELAIAQLEAWGKLGPDWVDTLATARRCIDDFQLAHSDYEATAAALDAEQEWLNRQAEHINSLARARQQLATSRIQGRAEIAGRLHAAKAQLERARAAREKQDSAIADLEQRYVDFAGAPDRLIELWDDLHAAVSRNVLARQQVGRARESMLELDRRVYWRRGLVAFGILIMATCLVSGGGWPGWLGVLVAAGLCVSLRWVYAIDPANAESRRQALASRLTDQDRAASDREAVAAQLGPRFVVPPEREAEWRRLWPSYRRDLERIQAESRTLKNAIDLDALAQQAKSEESRLRAWDNETSDLEREADEAFERANAESQRRRAAFERLEGELAAHRERFFGSSKAIWQSQPVVELPDIWHAVLRVAEPAGFAVSDGTAGDLVAWCGALDDEAWSSFGDACGERDRLESELATAPDRRAAHALALAESAESLRTLEEQQAQLRAAVAPFSADTDLAWLRGRAEQALSLESRIAMRMRELEEMPSLDSLAQDVARAESDLATAVADLSPYLAAYGDNCASVVAGYRERSELARQMRDLENQSAEFLEEVGFASIEQLAHEAGKAEGLVGTIRSESQDLLERAPELWAAVDGPPDLAVDKCAELAERRAELESARNAAERDRAELVAAIRHLESDPTADAAAVQIELDLLRGEQAELEKRRDQLAEEFHETNRLMQELKRVERTALEGRITAYFADFSRTTGRRVELDDDLVIRLQNEDGTRYTPEQLSHGARDQLYLAVYFATTAGLDLPFVLDDPFVNCDAERLAAIRACWDRLIPDHQLVLLSHDPHLAAWAPSLEMRDAA